MAKNSSSLTTSHMRHVEGPGTEKKDPSRAVDQKLFVAGDVEPRSAKIFSKRSSSIKMPKHAKAQHIEQ